MNIKHLNLVLLLSVLALQSCSQKSDMDKYIDSLMSGLTVDQKIGQLNLHSASGFVSALTVTEEDQNVRLVKSGMLGGMYGSGNLEYLRQVQEIAVNSEPYIPLIFGMDVIHGCETVMPIPIAMASSWNLGLIEEATRVAAKEASASGINWVFSPMVDVARDARWGRIAEGAGEDPYLGGRIAETMVRAYQGSDGESFATDEVMACVKHYAMYGGAEGGRDYNTVQLSRQEALNGFMNPYKKAAEASAGSFMSSFNEFEGIPATMNEYLLDELLRGEYGFNGFVVTDATAINEEIAHGIGDLQEVSARSLQAGIDMDMNSDGFIATLKNSLDEGRISEKDIDRACRRVLEAKYKLGLFDDPFRYLSGERSSDVYSEANKSVALKVAEESVVLLKNDGVLPLRADQKVAVIGPLADDATSMSGTWATSSHNSESITVLQGIREIQPSASYAQGSYIFKDEELESKVKYGLMKIFAPDMPTPPVHPISPSLLLNEALSVARSADVIVACVGETSTMNGEGASRSDITIPDAQRELLEALNKTGKPVVLVLSTGRPLALEWENENMSAIVNAWAGGSQGGRAIAEILFGKVNPSAKLTLSFPYSVGQEPLYYNHKNTGRPHPDYKSYQKFTSCYMDVLNGALFPFGYGLSYTNFKYGNLRLSNDTLADNESVTASIDITNTGTMDGKEIVQLYIHDVYSTSTRPVKELRGFEKVFIPAGETRTVQFLLTKEDLKYYNHDLEYVCEPGDFEIMVGTDSQRLETALLKFV